MRSTQISILFLLLLRTLIGSEVIPQPPHPQPLSNNLERGARSLIDSEKVQHGADELKLSRIIDTGKVIIPKPKVLDDLPDEYHITGQLIDEKDNSAILFVEIYVLIDGKEFAKGGTDKSGNFRLIFQRMNMTAPTAKILMNSYTRCTGT